LPSGRISLRQVLISFNDQGLDVGLKAAFPYESITSSTDLLRRLPCSYSEFSNNLSGGKNSLDIDYEQYQQLIADGLTQKQALGRLHLTSVPESGPVIYDRLLKEWELAGHRTMKDLLIRSRFQFFLKSLTFQ